MRILLTLPSLAREFGGPVDHARALRDALRTRGLEARLVGAGTGDGEGLPIVGSVRGTPLPGSFRHLRAAIRGADIVHVFGYRDPVGTVASWAAFRADVPLVFEPSGMHRPRVRSVAFKRAFDATVGRSILDHAAAVVATSELERRELIEDGIDPASIRTRRNGLTLPPGVPGPRGLIRRQFGMPSDAPMVLALGRITRKKGLTHLMEAVSRLPSAHLLITGPDSNDGTLSELRRRSSIMDGRVHIDVRGFWGRDKLDAFADADCFALPSQTENFGNAAAEAAALGVPVVVTTACGVAEVLDPSVHRVIAVGDVDALRTAIADLLRGAGPRGAAMSAAPRLRQELDWSTIVDVQLAIYRGVLPS